MFALFCYIGDDGEEETQGWDEGQPIDDQVITRDISHLHSMSGNSRSRPFQVVGEIGSTEVTVLIDTGSTHDFLHPCIAERLKLSLTPIRPFRIYVGNGASLTCSHVSSRTKLSMQGSQFVIDLHILDIHGPDVILGMTWLESLGKISADFVGKTLEFHRDDKRIFLQGSLPGPKQISLHSLALLASFSPAHEYYELVPLDPNDHSASLLSAEADFPSNLPADFRGVLEEHRRVFDLPEGMPPARPFDHRIHLLPHSKPINVCPYRYPYFQKNEIKRQVKEMLEQGIIQRSQSPFSSPVF